MKSLPEIWVVLVRPPVSVATPSFEVGSSGVENVAVMMSGWLVSTAFASGWLIEKWSSFGCWMLRTKSPRWTTVSGAGAGVMSFGTLSPVVACLATRLTLVAGVAGTGMAKRPVARVRSVTPRAFAVMRALGR